MKQAQKEIKSLANLDVDKYVRKAKGACEENVKIKIVIPLLNLLGYSTQQDMDFEHHVENKKADIALIFDNKPKLLIETKDLDEKLDNHVNQGLNYAYLKGIEWVMLTNGLEIRIYKSFVAGIANPKDRLLFETSLKNLPEFYSALSELISKEHLQEAKKLSEQAESLRENITAKTLIDDLAKCREKLFSDLLSQFKARYQTDLEFKQIIDVWAADVKMDVSDPELIDKLCREGAYTLINRVLFLRICEDKGHVKSKLSKDAITKWRQMVEKPSNILSIAFNEIGERFEGLYKSPLFDSINFEDIDWNSDTIDFVLDKLGEHDFSKISKDVLGNAYERHISREERKRLGQFYTPDLLVNYILNEVNITPDKKILDPACGSGGFLIKAYDRLRKLYTAEGWEEGLIHAKILEKNLFGIDINPFATQLTVMNLLLKDLDHPTSKLNVVGGNSLEKLELTFDLDIYETEHPLSSVEDTNTPKVSLSKLLKNRPFDIIVSNPPYIFTRSMAISELEKGYYKKHYQSALGKVNTFALFIEAGIERLSDGGKLGFIVPNTLLRVSTYEPLRNFILNNCAIEQIVDLGKGQFEKVTAETIVIILRKEADKKVRESNKVKVISDIQDLTSNKFIVNELPQLDFDTSPLKAFNIFVDEKTDKLLSKIEEGCTLLGKICEEIIEGIVTPKGKANYITDKKLGEEYKKFIEGKDIDRYRIIPSKKFILYDRKVLHRARPESIFLAKEKILVRRISGGLDPIVATLDRSQYYTFASINNIILKTEDKSFDARYVLALLNSNLMNYYFRNRFTNKADLTVNVSKGYLEQLPLKPCTEEIQSKIGNLVDSLLQYNQKLNGCAPDQELALKGSIAGVTQQIDDIVFSLYKIEKTEF
ncbi:MAG: N-6 DNA methylase [Dehalococcoidales bacterium]|nr:N-6 DNA methylase [Dehalococcoidales bacterium]